MSPHRYFFLKKWNVFSNSAHILKRTSRRGFTIVEMLIVIAISVALSSVFLANHNRFRDDIALSTITYDVALALRQAQVFGQSTRAATEVAADTFRVRYGVNFSINTPTSFFIFADRGGAGNEGDGIWDNGVNDKNVETYTLTGGNRINRLCVVLSGVTTCTPGAMSSLYVSFERPFRTSASEPLGAFIRINGSLSIFDRAQIEVANSSGRTRTVTVWSSGQISVQ